MSKPVKKPRKKATNGYKMPDPLPQGEILTDIGKNRWKLGTSIGKGGFGEIYSAQNTSNSSSKYNYVVKVEPHGNGPLFVEMHFYMRNAKQDDISAFMKKHKLKTFGMPAYLGSGSHETGGTKYRFIVMEKFGEDIDKLRQKSKGMLPPATVFQLAWQITYVLEYIHEMGYVHADIKGGNVLLGASPATKNQAYLVDFGLATKYSTEKEFKPNPKKAHDGTIEYLSRDAHQGVPTRRGDFEILAYNLIHWLGGSLPWDSKLGDPKVVQKIKEESLEDIPKFLKSCLKKNHDTLFKFLDYVNKLEFNEKPDYKKIRSLFEQEVKKNGSAINSSLEFKSSGRKRKSEGSADSADSNSGDEENEEVKTPTKKKVKKQKDDEKVEKKKPTKKKVVKKEKESNETEVMTPAMKAILAKKEAKKASKNDKKVEKVISNGELNVKEKKYESTKVSSPRREGRLRRNLPTRNYNQSSPDEDDTMK